ncbi:hypothetical protein ACQKGO_38250 [Corallococcus interemptor]|uniref:hypothetical protein n=1 Tax=Corallococcus interemptor TaxID=2316720 RepID=UPI003D011ABA
MREGTPFDPVAVVRIRTMLEMGLVGLKEIIAWADAWVMKLDDSPLWLLEMCTAPDVATAVGLIYGIPMLPIPATPEERRAENADHLACLFLRHRRGGLSWGEFLFQGGQYLDRAGGPWPCETFFMQLNLLERMGFPEDLVRAQREDIEHELREALERMESAHRQFEAEARGA